MRISLAFISLFLLNEAVSFSVKPWTKNYNGGVTQLLANVENDDSSLGSSRRGFITSTATATLAQVLTASSNVASADEGVEVKKTKSGLKYIELKEGTGPKPRYGQLITVKYTGYIKLPNEDKKKFDTNEMLMKHGNGRIIAGLEQGLHTMKVGGVRRLIIPPKLGYVTSGLGPFPEMPWNRWALEGLLDKMVEAKGGDVIFDVELLAAIDDEADQGYYQDDSMSAEDFETLKSNLQRKADNARNSVLPNGAEV